VPGNTIWASEEAFRVFRKDLDQENEGLDRK
jgi:hypothetical protein